MSRVGDQGTGSPGSVLMGFEQYHNDWRAYSMIRRRVPTGVHAGQHWEKPERTASVPNHIERCLFSTAKVMGHRLVEAAQRSPSAPGKYPLGKLGTTDAWPAYALVAHRGRSSAPRGATKWDSGRAADRADSRSAEEEQRFQSSMTATPGRDTVQSCEWRNAKHTAGGPNGREEYGSMERSRLLLPPSDVNPLRCWCM